MGGRPVLALVVAAALASGCGSNPASPSAVRLLPDVYRFECGGWRPSVPPVERTVIDVTIPTEATSPGSTDLAIRTLESAGARHLYTFNGPRIRLEMDVAHVALYQIIDTRILVRWASTVPIPTSYRIPVVILYARVFTEFDQSRLQDIGAIVTGVTNFATSAVVNATIEDPRIPEARRLPDVTNISIGDVESCDAGPSF
jgi:hypothetical protein